MSGRLRVGSQVGRRAPRWVRALFLLGVVALWGQGKETWTEVRSPHFVVYCEDGEEEARRILKGFEAIRSVFGQVFPSLQVDPPKPMLVIVTRDEASMKRFRPASFEGKDPVRHAGFYQQGVERNYALLRLDVAHQTDQPYFVVFHEYAHGILHQNFPSLPLWLDEGLADFYGATELHGNRVQLGRIPLDRLATLRRGGLLPLETLLAVTRDSPHYQEGTKAGPFYAQSWALVHYLLLDDKAKQAGLFRTYLKTLDRGAPPSRQAQDGLGDLKELSKALSAYVQRPTFLYLNLDLALPTEGAATTARVLDEAEVLVIRAEFLLSTSQEAQAGPLLDQALALAPQRPEVHAAIGMAASLRRDREKATAAFEVARRLGSRDFRVPYHLATLAQADFGRGAVSQGQILAWLEEARSLRPDFPGTWMALCRQYTIEPRDEKKALEAGNRAVALEPNNLANLANLGNACMSLDLASEAMEIGDRLNRMASSPAERRMAETYADQLAQFRQYQQQRKEAQAAGGHPGLPAGAGPAAAAPPLKFSLPSNLTALGQEVIQLVSADQLDLAIQKVEATRKKVGSAYEKNSLKALLDQLKARKAVRRPLPEAGPAPL